MKKAFLIIGLLFTITSYSQFSLGIGGGVVSSGKPAVQLSINYNGKLMGVDGGYIGSLSPSESMYFTGQAFKSLYTSETFKFVPRIGYAYELRSSDNKALNGSHFIFGLGVEKHLADRGILFINTSFVDDKMFLIIGLRGIFGDNPRRCL